MSDIDKLSNTEPLHHTPEWYKKRCTEENNLTPIVRTMLKSDMLGEYDPDVLDIENITYYETDVWDSNDFVKGRATEIQDVILKDMRDDDIVGYKKVIGDISSEEEHYDKLVEKISRRLLAGSDDELRKTIRQIRKFDESGKAYNKKQRERLNLKGWDISTDKERLHRDDKLFSWREKQGCNEDWTKETNHHAVITTLIEGIKEKINNIVELETKTLDTIQKTHQDRLDEMLSKTKSTVENGWVNRITLMSIAMQNEYQTNRAQINKEIYTDKPLSKKQKQKIKDTIYGKQKKVDYSGLE